MSSPLRPNIHFKVNHQLSKLIKPNSKICSYFLYDGNVELSLNKIGHSVFGVTDKDTIFNFWNSVLCDPETLSNYVKFVFNKLTIKELYGLQNNWWEQNNKRMVNSLFFILNNCSSLGYASCGKININKINKFCFHKLKHFKVSNFSVFYGKNKQNNIDYNLLPIGEYSHNIFEQGKNKGPEMYTFNHKEIHARVKDLDKKCILLYKNHPALFNLYKSFNIKMVDKYGRVADNKESCEDLIITNFWTYLNRTNGKN